MEYKAPKGTKDVLPAESHKWQYIEREARAVTRAFGYNEIRTPVFEHTELFLRGVGDTTDIVQKEMYTFEDKKGRSITLKPEGTAGVARAFLESGLAAAPQPVKMYYLNCPVFRYEQPQSGRLREHHQFGIEAFGAKEPSVDAEIIALAMTLFKRLGVTALELRINSIGCPDCRPGYNQKLREYFEEQKNLLCPLCNDRLEKNPLRILDCKEEKCKAVAKGAPLMLNNLCDECEAHFGGLKEFLGAAGLSYEIDPFIVRGLDYYTKTVFEIVSQYAGAQGTVCGGGRYDGLIEQLGGKAQMCGIGFGMGMERLLMVMEGQGISAGDAETPDIFLIAVGESAKRRAFEICMELREGGVSAEVDHCARSVKAQMKFADKLFAKHTAVIGDDELASGGLRLRDMKTGENKECELNADAIAKLID